jgi:hypothetical protein
VLSPSIAEEHQIRADVGVAGMDRSDSETVGGGFDARALCLAFGAALRQLAAGHIMPLPRPHFVCAEPPLAIK